MKNLIRSEARLLPWTNGTGADVAAGEVVGPLGASNTFAVAVGDIADGAEGTLDTGLQAAEFEAAKASVAWSPFDILYWDASAGTITNTGASGANERIGIATDARASGDAVGRVKLNA